MTKELLEKLLEYIDARIAEKSEEARNSSDGGLLEAIRADNLREELFAMVKSSPALPHTRRVVEGKETP